MAPSKSLSKSSGPPDYGIDAFAEVAEQILEHPRESGVEDEGSGHEGHAQHHGKTRRYEAQLVGPQRAEGRLEHGET